MKSNLVLLLTEDIDIEEQSAEAARKAGASLFFAQDVGEGIRIVCGRGGEIDLVIIDLDHGCDGMILLSALSTLRDDLPIVVIASTDMDHAAALAYAFGAAACLAKPINAIELEIVFCALVETKLQVQAASCNRLGVIKRKRESRPAKRIG